MLSEKTNFEQASFIDICKKHNITLIKNFDNMKLLASPSGDVDNGYAFLCAYIKKLYSNPNRHYHTLSHVYQMLTFIRKVHSGDISGLCLNDYWKDVLEVATLFHDIGYTETACSVIDSENHSPRSVNLVKSLLQVDPTDETNANFIKDVCWIIDRHSALRWLNPTESLEEVSTDALCAIRVFCIAEVSWYAYSRTLFELLLAENDLRRENMTIPKEAYITSTIADLREFLIDLHLSNCLPEPMRGQLTYNLNKIWQFRKEFIQPHFPWKDKVLCLPLRRLLTKTAANTFLENKNIEKLVKTIESSILLNIAERNQGILFITEDNPGKVIDALCSVGIHFACVSKGPVLKITIPLNEIWEELPSSKIET